MVNYVKRFIYVDATETRKVNPLFYPFLFATLTYGIGFFLLGFWSGVNTSSLFQAFSAVHPWLPEAWGACAVIAGGSATALLLLRHGKWGNVASFFGCLVWIFAAIIYGINGYWLVLLTVTAPNLYFWIYYYLKVKSYMRDKKHGLIKDPG